MKTSEEWKQILIKTRRDLEEKEWELTFLNPENKGFEDAFNKVLIKERYIQWLERKFTEAIGQELKNNANNITEGLLISLNHLKFE